jgi:hypothetical protein
MHKPMDNQQPEKKVIEVYVTDSQLHTVEPRKPSPWYRAIMKTLNSSKKEPGRFYTKDFKALPDGTFKMIFDMPPEMKKKLEEAEKNGQEIRFILPPGGAPVFLGKDALEKLEADKRKKQGG